jgi:peptidoglycan/xylan/chitin deacetylase (PgdA/CDA1 family)
MRLFPAGRSRDIVLLYHRVARVDSDPWSLCVTPEHFAEHLEVLRKYRRIRLDQVSPAKWRIGRGDLSVAITFDDGYADNLYAAKPLLERYDTPATFFIATGYVGESREFWWDELERIILHPTPPDPAGARLTSYFALYQELQPLPHSARREILDRMLDACGQGVAGRPSHRALTPEEVCQLGAGELLEIGSHTVTHPLLAAQPLNNQYDELRESKTWLENLLGRPIASLSFPYGGAGHYTAETVQAARDLGFSRACTTAGHALTRTDGPFQLPRFNVTDMNGEDLERFLFS